MALKYGFLSLDLRLAVLIFILTASLYLIFMDGNMTSDGYYYFLCAQSIVRDHDLSIEPKFPYGTSLDVRARQGIDGKKYLYKHFGWAILLLPLVALGTFLSNFFPYNTLSMFIASTTNCFITALTCLVLYLFSRRLKYPPRTSILLSLLYAFTTIAFFYATTSFCEPANTLMILLSLFWLYCYVQDNSYPMLVLSGLAMGYACFIRIWDLFLLPGPFLYLIFYHLKTEKSFKPLKFLQESAIFFLPILFMVLIDESYFYVTCGDSYLFGEGSNYAQHGLNDFGQFKPFSMLPTGLYGLLFSAGKGFFFYNPVVLFSLFCLSNFYLKHCFETWIFAYIFIAHLIFIGSLEPWSGDIAWGPRYLLPAIPFLILFLGEWKNSSRKRSLKTASYQQKLLIAGALAGLIVQTPSILVDTDVHTVGALNKGIKHEEIYFIPSLSPIIGTWNMLSKEIGSFSKDKSNGLSPWFFRIFDREIYTQRTETMPITPKIAVQVWTTIFCLIIIALGTILTILYLLR